MRWRGAAGVIVCASTPSSHAYSLAAPPPHPLRIVAPPQVGQQGLASSSNDYQTGANFSSPHAFGVLWTPATPPSAGSPGTHGSALWFFDRVPIPSLNRTWAYYNCTAPPADSHQKPSPSGTLFGVMDCGHLLLTLNTGPFNPLTVHSVSVWQPGTAGNLYGAGYGGAAAAPPAGRRLLAAAAAAPPLSHSSSPSAAAAASAAALAPPPAPAPFAPAQPRQPLPPQLAALGYTRQTFSTTSFGAALDWANHGALSNVATTWAFRSPLGPNYNQTCASAACVIEKGDGPAVLNGTWIAGAVFGTPAGHSAAAPVPWRGQAFGGGGYFEARSRRRRAGGGLPSLQLRLTHARAPRPPPSLARSLSLPFVRRRA